MEMANSVNPDESASVSFILPAASFYENLSQNPDFTRFESSYGRFISVLTLARSFSVPNPNP